VGVLFVLAKLKAAIIFLKTGISMIISICAYAYGWGWAFAVGFVLLIFVHECGHLLMARRFGLKVSAPLFIPFVGAAIAMKEMPRDAWTESWIALGGPLLGSVGALACVGLYALTHMPIFLALASVGFILNLFNLLPLGMLDGGRIIKAISPWLCIPGIALAVLFLCYHFSIIVFIILLLALPSAYRLIRGQHDRAYYVVTPRQRSIMTLLYGGLIAALIAGAYLTYTPSKSNVTPAHAAGKIAMNGSYTVPAIYTHK
jgi:Zn-dependent protease